MPLQTLARRPTRGRHTRRATRAAGRGRAPNAYRFPENLPRLIRALRALGVRTATARFSGTGDASWVDRIDIAPRIGTDITVRVATAAGALETLSVAEAVEEIADEIVAMRTFHWDAGAPRYGTVNIDVRSGGTTVAVHAARTN